MLKHLITRLLNHVVNQNSWAKTQLQPYGGRTIRLRVPPASAMLTILEDGGLALAGDASVSEATLTIPVSVAMRLLANDESATTEVGIDGNTALATAVGRVLRGMRWEAEEDLSRLIGDAPAHQIAEFGRKTSAQVSKQVNNLAEMLAEYWQEEQPLIAKKRHVDGFVAEVDVLREDIERSTKRLEKLEAALASTTPAATVKQDD